LQYENKSRKYRLLCLWWKCLGLVTEDRFIVNIITTVVEEMPLSTSAAHSSLTI